MAQQDNGLPPGWEVRISKSRGLPYYFSPQAESSLWEPPDGTDRDLLQKFVASNMSTLGQQPSTDGKIRAAHLLVKHKDSRRPASWKEDPITRTKEEAIEILKGFEEQIRSKKTTLADLAKNESDCASHSKGGDLGFFGRGDMQKPFETAAYGLQPGELSSIVETDSGVHLIERLQ